MHALELSVVEAPVRSERFFRKKKKRWLVRTVAPLISADTFSAQWLVKTRWLGDSVTASATPRPSNQKGGYIYKTRWLGDSVTASTTPRPSKQKGGIYIHTSKYPGIYYSLPLIVAFSVIPTTRYVAVAYMSFVADVIRGCFA